MRTKEITKCVYCDTSGKVEHDNLKDHLFGSPGSWAIRRCHNCLLAWADPQPVTEDIGALYNNYYTHDTQAAAPDAQISSLKKRALKHWVSFFLPWRRHALLSDGRYLAYRKAGRLLDVGCGNGNFLAGMANRGWTPVGVEFDENAVSAARLHGLTQVHHGSLEAQKFPDGSFDAITLSNVIEHLPDPASIFAELKRILSPGGRLVIITPNINSDGHAIFDRCWRGLEPPRHLFLFNCETLTGFAQRVGLTVEACFTVPGRGSGILESSRELWNRKPRHKRIPRTESVYAREMIKTMLGGNNGEFAVLLATT